FLGAAGFAHARTRARVRSAWATLPSLYLVFRALHTASMVRPQGWTFLLLAVALWLVDRLREKARPGEALALALVVALSIQLHGGFVFVLAGIGLVLAAWTGEGPRERRVRLLAAGLGVGALGAVLHPQGPAVLLHPLRYVGDARVREMVATTQE